jgi:hypothetical protein
MMSFDSQLLPSAPNEVAVSNTSAEINHSNHLSFISKTVSLYKSLGLTSFERFRSGQQRLASEVTNRTLPTKLKLLPRVFPRNSMKEHRGYTEIRVSLSYN